MAVDAPARPGNRPSLPPADRTRSRQPASSGKGLLFVLLALLLLFVAGASLVAVTVLMNSGPVTHLTHRVTRGDLLVTVTEQGTLESSDNIEIKCKVRGQNTVTFVVESGTTVEPGDELVRLDTLFIEEQINERSKYAHWSRSGAEMWKANAARARLAVSEYQEGRFISQVMGLEKDLAISESRLLTAKNMLRHARMMADRGYISDLEVEEREFNVTQATLGLEVQHTLLDVLKRFTKAEQIETLRGNLRSADAEYAGAAERAEADASRRDRALEELKYCIVTAPRGGMVIHPSAARWKNAPEIEEGGTVHKDQILLLMPDLSRMQVKVGIHESLIDRINVGLSAKVTLPDRTLHATVTSVAEVTRPAGWWTGNVVKYDTIIRMPDAEVGLKPGMSAEVEVILAEHRDVLTVPVAAVVDTENGQFCWIQTAEGITRTTVTLGDSNDMFIVVTSGLKLGDEVILNPTAFIEEAQDEALKAIGGTRSRKTKTAPKPKSTQKPKSTPKPATPVPAVSSKPDAED